MGTPAKRVHQASQSAAVGALVSNDELDLILLRLAELVRPCAADVYLEGYHSLASVVRRLGNVCLYVSDQAEAIL